MTDNFKLNLDYNQFPKNDVIVLKKLLSMVTTDKPVLYELGSWTGSSTIHLAQYIKEHGGSLDIIDPFTGDGSILKNSAKEFNIKDAFTSNMEELNLLDYININEGYSYEFNDNIKDESIDFVFIDADHRYSGISLDIKNYYPKVKKGGIICGHDFNGPDWDERYIEEDFVNGMHHGVTKAVVEKFPKFNNESNIWWVIK